jgi:hypothetical protein
MATRSKKKDMRLADLYAKVRREFSAADLAKFTELTPTVPAREVLAELEVIHQRNSRKQTPKKSSKK